PTYREGRAEATGLADATANAVLAAQAFHWFDPSTSLREFHRILKPDGWVALVWNERDETDACTAAYGAVIRSTRGAAGVESGRAESGAALLVHPLFREGELRVFRNEQRLDEEGLLGRALSISYAPREPEAVESYLGRLRDVFRAQQQGGTVTLRYQTSVY